MIFNHFNIKGILHAPRLPGFQFEKPPAGIEPIMVPRRLRTNPVENNTVEHVLGHVKSGQAKLVV